MNAQSPRNRSLARPFVASFGVAAVTMVTTAPATAAEQTLLVEFSQQLSGDGPGGTWNKFSAPTGVNGSTLVDSAGTATSVTLSAAGNFTASTNAGTSLAYDNTAAVGNPAWVATATNNLVAGDLFYTDNAASATPHQVVLTFGGLTPGNAVAIDFLASRNTGGARGFYAYSLDGVTYTGLKVYNPDGTLTTTNGWDVADSQTKVFENLADGYTAHRYMRAENIVPTGTQLFFRALDADTTTGNFASLNAMRLTVVPEPASAGLAAVALGLLAARRRRATGV